MTLSAEFSSFLMGGFECATHRRLDGKRVDSIATSGHAERYVEDYSLLARAGIHTVRDSLRWHLIETSPSQYDWSSLIPMLEAAYRTRTQVIWDLCHWGVPEHIDPFSAEFVERFGSFAAAAAAKIRSFNSSQGINKPTIYCLINEISFWAWVGGDVECFYPYGKARGQELKRQLVRASVAAVQRVREVDQSACFIQPEPTIHISTNSFESADAAAVGRYNAAQFEAWDMLIGKQDNDCGGSDDCLDLIGVNYYWNNQWIHEGERTPPGHLFHRPLHELLIEIWLRYHRPIVITETGVEGTAACGWLAYICGEVRQAQRRGVPIRGICIYPVMDYSGWDDDRHCRCGLIETSPDWGTRTIRPDLCEEVRSSSKAFGKHK